MQRGEGRGRGGGNEWEGGVTARESSNGLPSWVPKTTAHDVRMHVI